MKTKITRFKGVLLALLMCLTVGNVWGLTYEHTIAAKTWSALGTETLSGIDWVMTGTGKGYWGYDSTKGQQFGSGSSPYTKLLLSTTGIEGTITSITIETSGASSVAAKVKTTVGGEAFGSEKSISTTNTAYLFEGAASGEIVIEWNQTSSKALYLKKITIEYTTGTVLPKPSFTYNPESIILTIGNPFIQPELSYEGSNDLSGLEISYESSNENVATVSADGQITLVQNTTGTTIITATVAETASHSENDATFELTVQLPQETYKLVTSIDELGESGTYLIVGKDESDYYAMGNQKSSNRGAVTVSLSNNQIETVPAIVSDDALKAFEIIIEKNEDSWYLFDHVNTGYLSPNLDEDKNGLYTNANPTKWVIAINNSGIATITGSATHDRTKLRFNYAVNNQLFSCYSSGQKDIYLYKKLNTVNNDGSMELSGDWTEEEIEAIDLNGLTSLDVTGITLPAGAVLNQSTSPNCLVYVTAENYDIAEAAGWTNLVVIDGTDVIMFEDFILTDGTATEGYPFYAQQNIEVENITYDRLCWTDGGWETIWLPFDVTTIHDAENNLIEGYDLKELKESVAGTITFKEVEPQIKANTPYMIRFPKAATDQSTYTFSGSGMLYATPDLQTATSLEYNFKGTYKRIDGEGKYLLTIDNENNAVFGVGLAGSYVNPFRVYLENADGSPASPSGPYKTIAINDDGATNIDGTNVDGFKAFSENGILRIISDQAQTVNIYGIDGRVIKSVEVVEGNNSFPGLVNGIYLINNQKVVIK